MLRFPSEMFAIFISTGENDSATVSHMLKFIGGLEQVPPLGLPNQITVKLKYFCSANCPCWPTASTCGPSITFPLHYDTYDAFCESMSSALIESCGFGFSKISSVVTIHSYMYLCTIMVYCNNKMKSCSPWSLEFVF